MSDKGQVRMTVHADQRTGPYHPMWNWFGYDEPNYTYTEDGIKLLRQLAAASDSSPHIRTHNLLTSGDGTAALKWGSTNAYTEDEHGNPVYDWTVMDRIFDAYVETGTTPFVQVAFTPEALSDDPGPYRHSWSLEDTYSTIMTGWASPPNDLNKWYDLVAAWAQHLVDRYGGETVSAWPWECWNEPDGHYWKGTIPEYCAMFDATVKAVKSVLPEARVGGPHTCGAHENPKAQKFLRGVLDYVVENELPIDFVAFHAKGQPKLKDGEVRMGLAKHLLDIKGNLDIIAEYPSLKSLPVIIGESDPEGCAACSARVHPQNAYRNGPLYGSYIVENMIRTYELSRDAGIHIEGAVTWAFIFDGQPWFDGFRDLATNGVGKPVLNAFRMLGMLGGDWVATDSDAALPLQQILDQGVRRAPDINCVATRDETGISVLIWNYHDDNVVDDAGTADIVLDLDGLPDGNLSVKEFRMDASHGNSFGAWQSMGSPQDPAAEQIAELEQASELPCIAESTQHCDNGSLSVSSTLPRQGVGLVRIDF
ncbi:GH39 family glycosyl hydrolase [Qingshengfaniella alkalisoli]|uniref:Beta-xylosidase n=1 Tax=Qingshengfaniella alkalisoli TaxID=2599296 RepID=A0A5B8J0Y2_9RHOB|nr:beta-xylosidase [Qingshengfaniella alkalisoli]QDY70538.1 beta-xylosidase [Qingshengfaniella alkalisoli]